MNKTKLMFVLLASLILGACSSNNDDDSGKQIAHTETPLSEAPVWQIDWSYNQERPNWTDPGFSSIYGNWTVLKVQIEKALKPFASEGDMMALFLDGELRGLATPAFIVGSNQVGLGKFVLKAWGNETGTETVNMSLQYYSQALNHIFTLSEEITLNSDETTGFETDFVPEFTYGSAKYPVLKVVAVESALRSAGITPSGNNLVGAFVGDECRGTAKLSATGSTSLLVYGRSTGESVTLKYYDAAAGKLHTVTDAFRM